MTGEVDRFMKTSLQTIDATQIGHYLQQADQIEDFIKSVREMAFTMLENDVPVSGYKLVAKRGTRQWASEEDAVHWMDGKGIEEVFTRKLISPAQAEKILKSRKIVLPEELVVSVSSGNTLANEDDPRPAILNLSKVLSKLKVI
jgi:hypothetical protein